MKSAPLFTENLKPLVWEIPRQLIRYESWQICHNKQGYERPGKLLLFEVHIWVINAFQELFYKATLMYSPCTTKTYFRLRNIISKLQLFWRLYLIGPFHIFFTRSHLTKALPTVLLTSFWFYQFFIIYLNFRLRNIISKLLLFWRLSLFHIFFTRSHLTRALIMTSFLSWGNAKAI